MIVFAGPTLSRDEAPDFEFRPPAAHGDFYRAAREGPAAIGLIDGYFDERPAVWHKEILWALAQGIPVYGAASMGALRAAELHVFGMRGVGRIFEDYRSGRLVADDAVALEHGPPETGYVNLSEPLVNIEATLARAVRDGIATGSDAEILRARARTLHYRERTWQALLDGPQYAALARWLPANRVDQKRIDALEMLSAMKAAVPMSAPDFRFQVTDLWRDVVDRVGCSSAIAAAEREYLLDEIRLTPGIENLRWHAMARRLLRRREAVPAADRSAIGSLRQKLGLYRKDAFDHWLALNGINEQDFSRLALEDIAMLSAHDLRWVDSMIDELRLAGRFGPIRDRANRKRAALAAQGREDITQGAAGGLAGLLAWFCDRRGLPAPGEIDAFCAALGFEDRAGFQRALARERLYCGLQPQDEAMKIIAPPAHGTQDG
jgi:hypothetical protein